MGHTRVIPQDVDQLVKYYDHYISVLIHRVSRGSVRSAEDLADLKQSVYLRIWETDYLTKYNAAKGAFSTYLYWLVRSVVTNTFDRNTRNPLNCAVGVQTSSSHRSREQEPGYLSADRLPGQVDVDFEDRQVASDLLARLDGYARTTRQGAEVAAVVKLLSDGYTMTEIAQRTGKPYRTIAQRRKAAERILRQQLHVA